MKRSVFRYKFWLKSINASVKLAKKSNISFQGKEKEIGHKRSEHPRVRGTMREKPQDKRGYIDRRYTDKKMEVKVFKNSDYACPGHTARCPTGGLNGG